MVCHQVYVHLAFWRDGDPGTVRQYMAYCDVVFSMHPELWNKENNGVVKVQQSSVIKEMNQHGGCDFRRGEEAEEGVGGGYLSLLV